MPRMRAASSSVGALAVTRRMCSRSIWSRVNGPPSTGAEAWVAAIRSGNAAGGSVSAGQTMAARSTAFRSSRTFPGQG